MANLICEPDLNLFDVVKNLEQISYLMHRMVNMVKMNLNLFGKY